MAQIDGLSRPFGILTKRGRVVRVWGIQGGTKGAGLEVVSIGRMIWLKKEIDFDTIYFSEQSINSYMQRNKHKG